MRFAPSRIAGAFFIDIDGHGDERGTFARTFCAETFAAHGLATHFPQCNASYSAVRGTLRGLHYQAAPQGEAKLVRATRGRVFDVAVDLRPGSGTYLAWDAVELDWRRKNAFYIPEGCAHGLLTLEDECEVFYQMSAPYVADLARCVRWDDPAFAIAWPITPTSMNDRDATCPYFTQGNDA
ncbi:dTDP-4-dehydrorhamnose 3,5-epimerase [Rhizobium azooxidifex]|uniref:dTDP-4-dehydrorhamnose 3,5-epimerase n=1 Tax=Mycoplana azooxidifex TaxID=1636188 RepID=A0A7W6DB67_9HYPH|nr:dTDP-4-dehydrorhamnose 3,5-epimerase [Mycoplana azooxidifex]MBB3975689.1 dTDP-4-dehydrorhamnose 3,5-epimerase [Mycoplana azooxidifex]